MLFLNKYKNSKNLRFTSFEYAINESCKRKHKIIVETGTARGKIKFFFLKKYNWKDGMSTIMFADYAKQINGMLHTCDISEENIKNAINFTKSYSNYIKYYIEDSVNFLKNFKSEIDFLYLDSLDGHNSNLASIHQLNEIKAAMNKINKRSLILLDDKGAKTKLSIDYLLKNNFKILFETNYQVLFSYE